MTVASHHRAQLAKVNSDCAVIDGGLRLPRKALPLFEKLVNAIHQGAPKAAIAGHTPSEPPYFCMPEPQTRV